MELWLISQDSNEGYDTYDSAVVVAESEDAAKLVHPGGNFEWSGEHWLLICNNGERIPYSNHTWVKPSQVKAERLSAGTPGAVICASFNAG